MNWDEFDIPDDTPITELPAEVQRKLWATAFRLKLKLWGNEQHQGLSLLLKRRDNENPRYPPDAAHSVQDALESGDEKFREGLRVMCR
jgi:hypothetical protein